MMMNTIQLSTRLLLCFVLMLSVACASSSSSKKEIALEVSSVDEEIKEAEEQQAAREQSLLEKKESLERKLAIQTEDNSLRLELAETLFLLGEEDAAFENLKPVLEADSQNPRALALRADIYLSKSEYKEGIVFLESKGVSLQEQKNLSAMDPIVLNKYAALLRSAKRFDDSKKLSSIVLSRHSGNAGALKNLALVYYAENNLSMAQTVAADALAVNAQDADLYNALGMIEVRRERFPLAITYFRKALAFNDALVGAHLNIASIALRYRDYETAKKHYENALTVVPKHADAHLGLGLALAGLQSGDVAIAQLEKALTFQEKSVEAMLELSRVYKYQKSDLQNALKWSSAYIAQSGKLASDHPALIHHQNIVNEIEAAQMAADALKEMEKEEQKSKSQAEKADGA
jgi:tetratricopeptide (TPR) repeat protein